MADTTISALTQGTPAGSNMVPYSNGSVTLGAPVSALFQNAGNIGIGTTSPVSKLHIETINAAADIIVDSRSSGAGDSSLRLIRNSIGYEELRLIAAGGGASGLNNHYTMDLIGNVVANPTRSFLIRSSEDRGATYTEHIRIYPGTSTGYNPPSVLIGTTAVNPSGVNSHGRVVIKAYEGGPSALTCYTSETGAINLISLENGNGQVGRIQVNASATSYLTSSDYRLKDNVQPMTGALAKVAALKPCTFQWRANRTVAQGFVAHELQEVCPDAVDGEKDAVTPEGNIKPQGIDTSKVVPLLTAALQEIAAKIEVMESRLTAMEIAG